MNTHEHPQTIIDDEISLRDIVNFLRRWLRFILFFGLIGIVIAGLFAYLVKPAYEATTTIRMAQYGAVGSALNSNNSNNTPFLTMNIESPALLIERLKKPSTYSQINFSDCGLTDQQPSKEILAQKIIKAQEVRGVGNVVNLSVQGASPEIAKACLANIFETIKAQQHLSMKPYQDNLQLELQRVDALINSKKELLSSYEKNNKSPNEVTLLIDRDQLIFFMQKHYDIEQKLSQFYNADYVTPVYAVSSPIYPKKTVWLIIGAMIGVLAGVMIALLRENLAEICGDN